jgi:hypothetical protein
LLLLYLRPYPATHTLSNTGRSKKWNVSGNVLVLAVHNYRVANWRGTAVVLYMRKCYAHQLVRFNLLVTTMQPTYSSHNLEYKI